MSLILEWAIVTILLAGVTIFFLKSLSDRHTILKWLLGGVALLILMLGTGSQINIMRDYNATVCTDVNNSAYCYTSFTEEQTEETADRMVLLYRIFTWVFFLYLVYFVFFVLIFQLPSDLAYSKEKGNMEQSPDSREQRRF